MPVSVFIITIISLKTHIFENVLLSTRRPHGRSIMNLFWKLKFSCTCSNSTSVPTPHPWNKARVKPPSVQASPANASYAQQFLSVHVSKSCSPMSDLVTRYGPQATRRSTCLVLVPFEHEPSKSECRLTKKKELRKNNKYLRHSHF
jgi:hypothetical protein